MQNTALKTASAIFLVLALAHLMRVILGIGVIIGHRVIPVAASIPIVVICLLLSLWMYKSAK